MDNKKVGYFIIKRIFDIVVSFIALIGLSIIILIAAILIRVKLGSPILFKQERVGMNNKTFKIIKFRTMTDARDKNGNLLPNEVRLTKFGNFLRSTSIDELPELWNVLIGEMSLVGPRPLHVRYLKCYDSEQIRRHNVLPGITGWAQINGRNTITWCEKFKLDIWYVDNRSFILDIKILFQTVAKVFKRADINQEDGSIMEDFNGVN